MGDIIAFQTTVGLVLTVLFHQFTLATHRLLAVLPGVIEVREIDTNANGCTSNAYPCGLDKAHQLFLLDCLYEPGDDEEKDDEQIIIGHLHVVGIDLKSREDSREQQAPKVFAPIGEHHTSNHRRQVSQCPYLPDMTCCNDDEEIGGEGPDDGT